MTLRFEEDDDLNTNLERFLSHMESEDPEMGAILRAHAATLLTAQDDTSRKTARTAFNARVIVDLEALLSKKPEEDAG